MGLVCKSFSKFIHKAWDLLKWFECPREGNGSGFLLYSFVKHSQPLVPSLGHPGHAQPVLRLLLLKCLSSSNPSSSLSSPATPAHPLSPLGHSVHRQECS